MATAIKNIPTDEFVLSGNGSCGGCPSTLALRIVGKALGENAVMLLTPSCTVASLGVSPKSASAWPAMNITFASAGSSAAGVIAAFESLKAKGKYEGELPTVFNWVGDGGTYDIGFQALSAAAERNDNIIHFCYNNEAYSNTGMQRSGATPRYAYTTTTPGGKAQTKKNMPLLMLDHNVPYVATASIAYPGDLYDKVVKAKSIKGFKYIEIFAPCFTGWGFEPSNVIEMSRMAVKTGAWSLFEAENGNIKFNAPTDGIISGKTERMPIDEYLLAQKRFTRIFKNGDQKQMIASFQQDIDDGIEALRRRAML